VDMQSRARMEGGCSSSDKGIEMPELLGYESNHTQQLGCEIPNDCDAVASREKWNPNS
jgi:hypothetical protein